MQNPIGMLSSLAQWLGREGGQGLQFAGHEGMDGLRWLQQHLGSQADQPGQPAGMTPAPADPSGQGMIGAGVMDPAASAPLGMITPAAPAGAAPAGRYSPQPAPAASAPAADHWKPSLLRTIDDAFGGMTFSQSQDQQRARHQAELQQPEMDALDQRVVQKLQADPLELALYKRDPATYFKQAATRYAYHDAPGGSTIINGPAGGSVVAPKVEKFDDRGGVIGVGPDGRATVDYTAARSPTFAENTNRTKEENAAKAEQYKEAHHYMAVPDGSQVINAAALDGGAPGTPPAASAPVIAMATAAGANPAEAAVLGRISMIESHGDQNVANNGSATGLFQLHPDTFARVGGKNINDPAEQTKAALTLMRENVQGLGQALGRQPTADELYLAHQQGLGGARALLTAPPEVNAIAALTPVYGNAARARKAIAGNLPASAHLDPDTVTAGQFVGTWRDKFGQGAGGSAGTSGQPGVIFANSGGDPLSDKAVEQAAQVYLETGQLPGLGNSKRAAHDRERILNSAADIQTQTGATGRDASARWAERKSYGAALTSISKQRAMIESFENTALANADLALSLAPKGVGGSNAPLFNKWLLQGRKALGGDVDVAKFQAALGTFADEYAKIISGSTGGQGTTDAARHEAMNRINSAMTLPQLQGVISVMKTEMANRTGKLREQEEGLRSQLRTPQPAGARAGAQVGRSTILGVH